MEDRSLRSILYVLPATAIGGAEIRFSNIIRHMKEVRSVLLTHSVVADYFGDLGISVRHFDEYGCHSPMPVSFRETVRYAKAVADAVKNEKIDCILGVMHVGTFYAAVAKDIFRLRQPIIGTVLGNISAYFSKAERKPTLLEKALLWYLLRRPSLLVVPSEGVKEDIVKNFRLSEESIHVIHNGIDIDRVLSMASERIDILNGYDGKIIITACRLNAQKDFFTLLEAFKEVRGKMQAKLVIVGDGELKEEIVKYAIDINIEKDLIITGFQKNPFIFMKKANVFVLSSFFEGFGNVIVEAMALGVPVVSTDCPSGPAEIIQDGINGFLVPIKNHRIMADRLLKLLTDEDLRRIITEKGKLRAACFGVDPMIEKFRKLISQS
jgi:glycosyltransferase involved in cell wall biosynthesis